MTLAPVLTNGRSLDDQLRAHHVSILANIAKHSFADAISLAMHVLAQLGEHFPNESDPRYIKDEIAKTQSLIYTKMAAYPSLLYVHIASRGASSDARKIATMRIMIAASRCLYVHKPQKCVEVVLRMVQIAMAEDGLTAEASYAFAAFSFATFGQGDGDVSSTSIYAICSKIATTLLKKFDNKYSSLVMCLLDLSILPYRQPMQACLESLRQSCIDACSVGEREWARACLNNTCQVAIIAPERGKTLDDVEIELRQMIQEFLQAEGPKSVYLSLLYFQMLLNLKGSSDEEIGTEDPSILTGTALDQDDFLLHCEEGHPDFFTRIYCCRMLMAYIFRQYGTAAEMAELCLSYVTKGQVTPSPEIICRTFYLGLTSAAMLQQQSDSGIDADNSKWHSLAQESLGKLSQWANEASEWNFQHKVELIRAEMAVASGNLKSAMVDFDKAIQGANKSCFVNEEALGNERLGLFHMRLGNVDEAKSYFIKAEYIYSKWGAKRKALDLSQLIANLNL